MNHVKAAVLEDLQSQNIYVLNYYRHIRRERENLLRIDIWSVANAAVELQDCVNLLRMDKNCLEILVYDLCNIMTKLEHTKEEFYAKVAQARQTPGFDDVPGLIENLETIEKIFENMDLDSTITNVQTFEA